MKILLLCIALILPVARSAEVEPKAIASEMVAVDIYSHCNEVYKKIMAWQKANVKEVKKVIISGSPVEPISIKEILEALAMPRGGVNNSVKKPSKGRN